MKVLPVAVRHKKKTKNPSRAETGLNPEDKEVDKTGSVRPGNCRSCEEESKLST